MEGSQKCTKRVLTDSVVTGSDPLAGRGKIISKEVRDFHKGDFKGSFLLPTKTFLIMCKIYHIQKNPGKEEN